jgi:thioredoxin 1
MKRTFFTLGVFFLVVLAVSAFKNYNSAEKKDNGQIKKTSLLTGKKGKVKVLDKKTFDKFIEKGIVVVDFWATWCPPCRAQGPIVEELSLELKSVKFGKLDVDGAREIARRYNIRNIPTLIIFKDGKDVEHIVGLHDKVTLKRMIEAHLK